MSNILILANHYAISSGRYAAEAFRRLGHTVYTDGPAMGCNVWGLTLPPWAEWKPEPMPDDVEIDRVIVMDSDPAVLDDSWFYVARWPIDVWGVDNHVRDYRRWWFRRYFLAHKAVSIMPWRDDMTWLPCAQDPTVFTPGKPWAERRYDVAMLGVMYPARREAVAQLRAAGLSVIAGTGLIGQSCAQVYQDAKISLCLSAAKDVGQRVFETAATGCVVFTDDCPDLAELNAPGLLVWDGHDLVDNVRAALADAETARIMTAMSTAWAQQQSWDARAAALLEAEGV